MDSLAPHGLGNCTCSYSHVPYPHCNRCNIEHYLIAMHRISPFGMCC